MHSCVCISEFSAVKYRFQRLWHGAWSRCNADDICHLLFQSLLVGITFVFAYPILNFLIYKERVFDWVVSRIFSSSHVLNSTQQPFGGSVRVGGEFSRGKYTSADHLLTVAHSIPQTTLLQYKPSLSAR